MPYLTNFREIMKTVFLHSSIMWKLGLLIIAFGLTNAKVFDIKNVTRADASTSEWWDRGVIYQIYPRSFKDSDDNGIGDLKGITSQLSYFKDLGVDGVWLSPIFKSPMADFGYDISDFRDIHPDYGTLTDFDQLLTEAKKLGIKIVMDLVPNHCSDEHEWFVKSEDKVSGFEDYFIWKDGKDDKTPPNNWISAFEGSAWTYSTKRKQWYLHQFHKKQPDLNYRNEKVVNEMKDVIKFWLDKGVDGFRIDAVPYLVEDSSFKDEPLTGKDVPVTHPDYLNHIYTQNQPEGFDVVYGWRSVIEDEPKYKDQKILMTEAYAPLKETMLYYGNGNKKGAHFSFNFLLITLVSKTSRAHEFVEAIQKWLNYMPQGGLANWVIGNHDQPRVGSRLNSNYIDGMAMMDLLLPGVGIIYQGEELGMLNGEISWEDTQDPQGCNAGEDRYKERSRDPARTPFHWDGTEKAGFTNGKPWLPIATGSLDRNVDAENKAQESHLKVYKQLIQLRKEKSFKDGLLDVRALSDNVIGFVRAAIGGDLYVVLMNMENKQEVVDLSNFPFIDTEKEVKIAVKSVGAKLQEKSITDGKVSLKPYEAYVLKAGSRVKSSAAIQSSSLFLVTIVTFVTFIFY